MDLYILAADLDPRSYAARGRKKRYAASLVLTLGHEGTDLTPDSTMTNATVEATVAAASAHELTLTYQGGQQRLVVPPGTPVVTLEPGNEQLLRPGSHVFLGASPNQDGSFSATRIMVGKDGLVPPM